MGDDASSACVFCRRAAPVAAMALVARDGGGYERACAECAVILEDAPEADD